MTWLSSNNLGTKLLLNFCFCFSLVQQNRNAYAHSCCVSSLYWGTTVKITQLFACLVCNLFHFFHDSISIKFLSTLTLYWYYILLLSSNNFNVFQSFLLTYIIFYLIIYEIKFAHLAFFYYIFVFLWVHGFVFHLPKLQPCSKCLCRTVSPWLNFYQCYFQHSHEFVSNDYVQNQPLEVLYKKSCSYVTYNNDVSIYWYETSLTRNDVTDQMKIKDKIELRTYV